MIPPSAPRRMCPTAHLFDVFLLEEIAHAELSEPRRRWRHDRRPDGRYYPRRRQRCAARIHPRTDRLRQETHRVELARGDLHRQHGHRRTDERTGDGAQDRERTAPAEPDTANPGSAGNDEAEHDLRGVRRRGSRDRVRGDALIGSYAGLPVSGSYSNRLNYWPRATRLRKPFH